MLGRGRESVKVNTHLKNSSAKLKSEEFEKLRYLIKTAHAAVNSSTNSRPVLRLRLRQWWSTMETAARESLCISVTDSLLGAPRKALPPLLRARVERLWSSTETACWRHPFPLKHKERESGVLVTADAAADKPTPEVQPASADDAWQLSEFSGWWFDPRFSPIKHVRARSKSTTYREQSIFGDRISSKICYTNHLCKDSGLLKYSIFHSISFRAGLQLFMIL